MCPIRELYNDIYSSYLNEILIVDDKKLLSYDGLRLFLKEHIPQLRKASNRHMEMCGCEICITIKSAQISLNKFCLKRIQQLKDIVSQLEIEIKSMEGNKCLQSSNKLVDNLIKKKITLIDSIYMLIIVFLMEINGTQKLLIQLSLYVVVQFLFFMMIIIHCLNVH